MKQILENISKAIELAAGKSIPNRIEISGEQLNKISESTKFDEDGWYLIENGEVERIGTLVEEE